MLSPNTSHTQRLIVLLVGWFIISRFIIISRLGCIINNYKLSHILFTDFYFESNLFLVLQYLVKDTVMQIVKALIKDRLRFSKVSLKFRIPTF